MKYMQTDLCGQPGPICRPIDAGRTVQAPNTLLWLTVLLIFGMLILFPERPAWGGEFNLETSPKGIQGYARQVSLGEILGYLAERNGYVIQIDQALLNAPVNFYIPAPMPPERAIQRMVHPHSLALVFNRLPGKSEPVISQIKVFDKGSNSASYALLSGQGSPAAYTAYAHSGAPRSGTTGGQSVQAGREAVQKQVRPPVIITKSSMGFTGFKFRDNSRGPDYRPNAMAMAQAYADYSAERNALQARAESGKLNSAKQNVQHEKASYRSGRTQSLQKTINDSRN